MGSLKTFKLSITQKIVSTLIASITLLVVLFSFTSKNIKPVEKRNYLYYVEVFANTLLDKGLDNYGVTKSPVWASVIDTRDYTVPKDGVPTVEGVREGDRAVGGSNLYHDIKTLSTFDLLSKITGKPKYKSASSQYKKYFLEHTQNKETGLLGWGEHLFYDLYKDSVTIEKSYKESVWGGFWHELLRDTPPWDELWEIDSIRTYNAIAGLKFHFYGFETKSFLYNRHANWDKAIYQSPKEAQPWIKHSGLYTQAFMFLYKKTNKKVWLDWAQGISSLYWDRRNQETNLTFSCLGDPRSSSMVASLSGMSNLAYYLLKSHQIDVNEKYLKNNAITLLKSIEKYSWDTNKQIYYSNISLDGTVVIDKNTGKPDEMKAWISGYGVSSLLEYGRIAGYFAHITKDKQFEEIAARCTQIALKEPFQKSIVAENLADAIHLNLDMYDLTKNKLYLDNAEVYANLGIDKLWKNGLFVRQTNDDYYEAKLGIGNLISGLLRLHLLKNPKLNYPGYSFWSI